MKRLEDEDLIKMNLDDAICGLSDDEIEALGQSGEKTNSLCLFKVEEEQKTQEVNMAEMQDEIK